MALFQLTLPCSSPLSYLKLESKPNHFITNPPILTLKPKPPSNSLHSSTPTTSKAFSNRLSQPKNSLDSIRPFIQSEWQPILKGWLCSAISVYSLSKIVPKMGKFSAVMGAVEVVRLREEGLVLGVFAFGSVDRELPSTSFSMGGVAEFCRDLEFFEGRNGVSAGDIAYRITAEAADVADTVNSLLNSIVPSTLQLAAMATQMLVISPLLSLISALVIPSMVLVLDFLVKSF
ncbi:unnamed protein product, partial [Ilex paraguariensis]